MPATIKDIAKVSGFGLGTVSRVLNGNPLVKDSTRERILEVIERLDYRPNKWAKNLVSGQYTDKTIGVILPRFTHKFSLEIIGGAYETLSSRGFNLLIFTLGRQREEAFEHIRYTPFSGILALINPLTDEEKQVLREHNSEFIYLDYHEEGYDSFTFDNAHGGAEAARYLLNRGCKSIQFIGDMGKSQQMEERFTTFQRTVMDAGMEMRTPLYIPNDGVASYRATLEIIKSDLADGLFFYSDDLALGGLQAKREQHSDIRIIGYDDIPAAGYMGLSTIRQDARELGHAGAERILDIIQRPGGTPRPDTSMVCFSPTLIDRQS